MSHDTNKSIEDENHSVILSPTNSQSQSQSRSQSLRKEDSRIEDAGDGTVAADQYLHGVKLILCSGAILLSIFLSALDQTIVSTILSTVGDEFNGFTKIGWLTSGFMLPVAVLAPTWGKISIIFGRKSTMLVSIILFEIGSLICALANSMDLLIGGRVIAGIGGGGIQCLSNIIASEIVPIQHRGFSFALIGAAFAISSVIGPLIGGAFTTHVTWRWCFYINLPIGGVAFLFLMIVFNPPKPKGSIKEKLKHVDYIGTFLVSAGVVLVLLALTWGGVDFDWDSSAIILCFVLGGLLVVGFIVWNFRFSKDPLIPWRIVRKFKCLSAALSMAFIFSYFMACVVFLAVYFQVVRGVSAWRSGIDLLPMIIATTVCSMGSGIVMAKTRYIKPILLFGTICGPIGCGLLTLLDVHSNIGARIGYLILPGMGVGLLFQSSMMSAQMSAPRNNGGTILAISLVNFSRSLGATIATDVAQTIFSSSVKSYIATAFEGQTETPSKYGITDPLQLMNSPDLIKQLPDDVKSIVLEEVAKAIRNVMYFALALSIVGFIFGCFTTNERVEVVEVEKQNKTSKTNDEEKQSDS